MRRVHCVPPGQPVLLNIMGGARNCLFVTKTSLNWNYPVWVGGLPSPRGFLILPVFARPSAQGAGPERGGWPDLGRSAWEVAAGPSRCVAKEAAFQKSRSLRMEACVNATLQCIFPLLLSCFNCNFIFCPSETKAGKITSAVPVLGYFTACSVFGWYGICYPPIN